MLPQVGPEPMCAMPGTLASLVPGAMIAQGMPAAAWPHMGGMGMGGVPMGGMPMAGGLMGGMPMAGGPMGGMLMVGGPKMNLMVTIVGARNLRAGNWLGSKHPYCTCEITGKPHTKVKSQTDSGTSDPVWNFSHVISDFSPGQDSLTFTVFDEAKSDHEPLGWAMLHSVQLFPRGFQGDLPLADSHHHGHGVGLLSVRVGLAAPVGTPVPPAPTATAAPGPAVVAQPAAAMAPVFGAPCPVHISLKSARGLKRADFIPTRSSDPYCVVEIPGKPESKFKTHTVDNNLNPVWNFDHTIPMYVPGEPLLFEVFDEDTFKSDDFLGRLLLQSNEFFPNGFNGSKMLQDSGNNTASLELVIQVLKPGMFPVQLATAAGASGDESTGCCRPFDVTIFWAKGLHSTGHNPFCVCKIVGGTSKDREAKHIKNDHFHTHTVSSTSHPVWNFTQTLIEYHEGCDLEFTVKDDHTLCRTLGKATLDCSRFYHTGFQGILSLSENKDSDDLVLAVKVVAATTVEKELREGKVGINMLQAASPLQVEPRVEPGAPAEQLGSLGAQVGGVPMLLRIVGARGLRRGGWVPGHTSDPYCVCTVEGKPHTKVQTPTEKNTTDPLWNSEHTISVVPGDTLIFTCFDKDNLKDDDFVGRGTLPFHQFCHGFQGDIQLKDNDHNHISSLQLVVLPGNALGMMPQQMPGWPQGMGGPLGAIGGCPGGCPGGYCTTGFPGAFPGAFPGGCPGGYPGGFCGGTCCPGYPAAGLPPFGVPLAAAGPMMASPLFGGRLSPGRFSPRGTRLSPLGLRSPGRGRITAPAPLKVTIVSAQGLRKSSPLGELDTFCTCEVYGRPHTRFQTQVYEDDRDPVWNFESVLMDYCLGDALLFRVYEEGARNVDTILGSALLRAPQLHSLAFEGMLTLVDDVDASRATLCVKVECFVPSFRPGFVGPGMVGAANLMRPGSPFQAAMPMVPQFGEFRPGSPFQAAVPMVPQLGEVRPGSPFQAAMPLAPQLGEVRPGSPFQAAMPMAQLQGEVRPASPFAADPPQVGASVVSSTVTAVTPPVLVTPTVRSPPIIAHPVEAVAEPVASTAASRGEHGSTTTTYAAPAPMHGRPTYAPPVQAVVAASGTATPPIITTPPVATPKMPPHHVKITIVSANGLHKARGIAGTCDPYVRGEISGKPHTRFTTPALQHSLNPVWNFEHLLGDYRPGDSITFTVYDRGSSQDEDHLGRGVLHGKLFDPAAGAPGPGFNGLLVLTHPDERRRSEANAMLTVKVDLLATAVSGSLVASRSPLDFSREADAVASARLGARRATLEPTAPAVQGAWPPSASSMPAAPPTASPPPSISDPLAPASSTALGQTGPVSMSLPAPAGSPHATPRSMAAASPIHWGAAGSVPLRVTMLSAQGLERPGMCTSPPEACCVCEVKGKPRTRFQTHVEADADPVWNYPEVLTEFMPGDTLTFSVYDEHEGTMGDRLLGRATLPSNRFYPQGFEGTLVLAEASKGSRATVAVRVDVLGATQPVGGFAHPMSRSPSRRRNNNAARGLVCYAQSATAGPVPESVRLRGLDRRGARRGPAAAAAHVAAGDAEPQRLEFSWRPRSAARSGERSARGLQLAVRRPQVAPAGSLRPAARPLRGLALAAEGSSEIGGGHIYCTSTAFKPVVLVRGYASCSPGGGGPRTGHRSLPAPTPSASGPHMCGEGSGLSSGAAVRARPRAGRRLPGLALRRIRFFGEPAARLHARRHCARPVRLESAPPPQPSGGAEGAGRARASRPAFKQWRSVLARL
ncbi:unnamed protein product [Prorocentrum cordatum]|uniref:C2 domain-containing protein n=1 Tax=Prorocentrum cordatum TaxID=2364126 RepID=A0ABN9YDB0_9DINO|nr:unnamed protein product [Polarella glacialis]